MPQLFCCADEEAAVPLSSYAERLRSGRGLVRLTSTEALIEMFVVPFDTLLAMTEIKPHEDLLAEGALVEFDESDGNAMFVSHQWAGIDHPDPKLEQFKVLQDGLRNALSGAVRIEGNISSELFLGQQSTLPAEELSSKPLFIWYDYFCCPQRSRFLRDLAISSIPAFVERCQYFVVLCPHVRHTQHEVVLNKRTWESRGWCRLERTARELSMRKTSGLSIDIQSATHLALAPTWDWIRAPVGDGFFTLEEDRVKLADVLEKMLHAKLKACLKQGDYHGYRLMLNMQQIHLRRLPTQPVEDVVPGFDSDRQDPATYVLERFLHQNGFRSAKCRDAAGWSPLSYAALSGNPMLIVSLLEQGADPNEGIEKFEPIFHFTPGTRALHISAFLGNNEGIRLLLERGADVQAKDNYDATPLHWAALGSNVEGIQVLCAADASCATFANVLGYLPLTMACMAPSVASMWELLPHTPKQELDVALHASILHGLPSAGMISALIEAGANVDARPATPLFTARGMLFAVLGVRHRFSESTLSTYAYYHCNATPLMCSVITCAFEATEALLAAGARTDLRNSRGRSAADLAKETSAPSYILAALKEAVA